MALSIVQLEDFRADIGDTATTPAFTDPELQRLYVRAGENYNRAVLLAIEQLIANAAKFNDYTQNESQEKKSQIFDHLLRLRAMWEDKVNTKKQVGIVGLKSIPPKCKDKPGGG